jgi:hypothetical protein
VRGVSGGALLPGSSAVCWVSLVGAHPREHIDSIQPVVGQVVAALAKRAARRSSHAW